MREAIFLACSVCKRRNYRTTKSKEKKTLKVELKKYCKWCKKHTVHKETKIK
ncbi:MAG: 50S ribosomal protein L33 [Candidatus Hydrothermales bacterium]